MTAPTMHPDSLGRYRVTGLLGAGAMGAVYLARDDRLGRDVAIKAMRPIPGHGDALLERFFNEAKAVAALSHPNIIRIFDVDEDQGVPFMVMEVAAGGSLKSRLEREPRLPIEGVRALGIQMALALAAAHERGIAHRDVKPANVLETEPGTWKLADFGVAHVPDAHLTMTGQFLGSPAYASPESLEQGAFGPASDVYGLAATLFEVVTGRSPHAGRGHETRIVQGDAVTSAQAATIDPSIPRAIREGILRGLAREASRRPSAAELAAMLASQDEPDAVAVAAVPDRALVRAVAPSRFNIARLAAAAGVVALLAYLIVSSGRTGTTPSARVPMASNPGASDDDHARRWARVNDRLREGEWSDADEALGEILTRYPEDAAARELRTRLRRDQAADRAHTRGRARERDRDDDDDDDVDEDVDEDHD